MTEIPTRRRLLALAGTLALAGLVSACGRKGPLEPPPGSWQAPEGKENASPPSGPVRSKDPIILDKLLN